MILFIAAAKSAVKEKRVDFHDNFSTNINSVLNVFQYV